MGTTGTGCGGSFKSESARSTKRTVLGMYATELDTNLGRATRVEGDRMDLLAARLVVDLGRMVWDEAAVLEPRAGQSFVLRL